MDPIPCLPSARRRSRWLTVAVLAVVAGFFVATLAARWNDVISLKWRLEPGLFARRRCCWRFPMGWSPASGAWPCAGPPGPGWPPGPGSGSCPTWPGMSRATSGATSARSSWPAARAWPGGPPWPSWPSPRSSRSGSPCWPGLPVLLAERARLGRPALLGAVVVAVAAALAALFRRQLLGLARRRLPGLDPADLTPSAATVARLVVGYAVYWAVTGLAFAPWWPASTPWPRPTSRLVVAAYAAAYAAGFLALLTPAGLGVREGVLVVALAPVLPAGPALVVALVSRVWMMLVELAGAGIVHLAARHRTRV